MARLHLKRKRRSQSLNHKEHQALTRKVKMKMSTKAKTLETIMSTLVTQAMGGKKKRKKRTKVKARKTHPLQDNSTFTI